jgi:hypothetical protein
MEEVHLKHADINVDLFSGDKIGKAKVLCSKCTQTQAWVLLYTEVLILSVHCLKCLIIHLGSFIWNSITIISFGEFLCSKVIPC